MSDGRLAPAAFPEQSNDSQMAAIARLAPARSKIGHDVKTHKRVRWRTPLSGKRRPGVIDATRSELVRGLELRHGPMWWRVSRAVAVAGYPIGRALNRVRALRSDGAESMLAMIIALLYLTDVRTGFIGKPRPERGPWKRYTLRDLTQLAYGSQTEADLRRARRSLDMLVSLGWAFPTKQVRRFVDGNSFRSEPAVRRLNLHRLCEMAGTGWLLSRDRKHADRVRGDNSVSYGLGQGCCAKGPEKARQSTGVARDFHPTRSTGDPPPNIGKGAQAIASILQMLDNG